MAEILRLPEAVAGLVHDGDAVALEGFTHLIPFAPGGSRPSYSLGITERDNDF